MDFMPNTREEIAQMFDGTTDWDWGNNPDANERASHAGFVDYVYNNCTDQADYNHHVKRIIGSDLETRWAFDDGEVERFWIQYILAQYLLSINDTPEEFDVDLDAIREAKKRLSDVVVYRLR